MARYRLDGSQPVTIVNLTVQGPGQVPYPQPPRSGGMADGVRRQFVNG